MAGQLTLGGLAAGLPGGQVIAGPNTVSGTKAIPEILNIELESGVEKKVKLPSEALQFALFFSSGGETGPELKLKAGTTEWACPTQGFFSSPVPSGVTELGFKAPAAPKVFQLYVI